MAKRTGPSNLKLKTLIIELKKKSGEVALWKRIAFDLERPTRQRRIVNLSRIERYTKKNETVIVPGKVLGSGDLTHSLTIAAFSFSQSALEKISKAKAKALSIEDLMKENIKGKQVRILG